MNEDGVQTNGGSRHITRVRSWQQREYDLLEEARLYAQGRTTFEIREHLAKNRTYTLTTGQINLDMKEVVRRWRTECISTIDDHKAKALAQIDEVYRMYLEAWENSKKPVTEVHTEEIDDKTTSSKATTLPAYSRRKKQSKVTGSYGEVRFLEGIMNCIKERCKILGLEAPQEINVRNWREEARKTGIDAGEVFNSMVGKFVSEAAKREGLDD